MKFYLGTHQPQWLGFAEVPLFVSHRRLKDRKTFPRAATGWALDSGGFTELSMHGAWQTTPEDYVKAVRRYSDEIGSLEWASPQDWMCEPWLLHGRTVEDHQRFTVDNLLELRALAPDLPFVPVLQGWVLDDYLGDYSDFEGSPVLATTIKVRNAGDGLSKALDVDPLILHKGQRVTVVLDCEVGPIAFPPIKDTKDTDGVARAHDLKALRATFIDSDVVRDALDAQQRRIDEAQGVQQLPFGEGEGEVEGLDPDVEPDPESDDLAGLAEDVTR